MVSSWQPSRALLTSPATSLCSIGGYPKFSSFGAVVGTRSAAGRDEFLAYHNAAICVPGLATDRVAQIAREHGVFIVSGLIEKDGGTLYCSVGFWSPANGLVYKRRKVRRPKETSTGGN